MEKKNAINPEIIKTWQDDLRMFTGDGGNKKVTKPMSQSYLVYKAIKLISENFPQAPFRIYKDNEIVSSDNPVFRLFNRPNPFMSRWELWEATSSYLNLYGEVFWILNKSMKGQMGERALPSELYPVNPTTMKIQKTEEGFPANYVYGNEIVFGLDEVIHFKFFNPYDRLRGLSPLKAIQMEVDQDYESCHFNRDFFKNGAVPFGVVELNPELELTADQVRMIRDQWEAKYSGDGNRFRTAFLQGGMNYKAISLSQKDIEFLEGRKFSREVILSAFGVPPFVAGFGEAQVNRATSDAAKRIFWTETLKPQMLRVQEKLTSEFFSLYAPDLEGRFDFSQIEELRKDLAILSDIAGKFWAMGFSRNEINARLDLGFPEDPDGGEIHYVPSSVIPEDFLDAGHSLPSPESQKAILGQIWTKQESANQYRQSFLKLQTEAENTLQNKFKSFFFNQRKEVLAWLNSEKSLQVETKGVSVPLVMTALAQLFKGQNTKLVDNVKPVYVEVAGTALEKAGEVISIKPRTTIAETIVETKLNQIKAITDKVYDNLKESLVEGIKAGETITDLSSRVREVYNVTTSWSRVVARTESASLINETSYGVYSSGGVQKKQWIGGERESHAALNGMIINMNETFPNGLSYPGDPSGPPEEVVNCRCTLVPVIE